MKFKSNSGKTLFMTIIIVLVVLQILLVKTIIYKISFIFLILDTVSIYPLL